MGGSGRFTVMTQSRGRRPPAYGTTLALHAYFALSLEEAIAHDSGLMQGPHTKDLVPYPWEGPRGLEPDIAS
jgi:hypothetical protein